MIDGYAIYYMYDVFVPFLKLVPGLQLVSPLYLLDHAVTAYAESRLGSHQNTHRA